LEERREIWRSFPHGPSEEHLCLDDQALDDGDEFGVAVPITRFQLVFAENEDAAIRLLEIQEVLLYQAARGREATLHEGILIDVIILEW
jgi:hypothetical protein